MMALILQYWHTCTYLLIVHFLQDCLWRNTKSHIKTLSQPHFTKSASQHTLHRSKQNHLEGQVIPIYLYKIMLTSNFSKPQESLTRQQYINDATCKTFWESVGTSIVYLHVFSWHCWLTFWLWCMREKMGIIQNLLKNTTLRLCFWNKFIIEFYKTIFYHSAQVDGKIEHNNIKALGYGW
jgi:hypothetical protein